MKFRTLPRAFCMALALLCIPLIAWGHAVELFATASGNAVRGTMRYPDGTRITEAPVRAHDPEGALLAETVTDEAGRFTLPISRVCDYRITGDAGEGHVGVYTVPESEIEAAVAAPPESPAPVSAASAPETDQHASADFAAIEARIDQAVARQLAPLREQLFQYERTTRFRDIVGGIGYLFGVAGLLALVRGRFSRRGG